MREDFLYYLWIYHLRLNVNYKTVDGEVFRVLDKGIRNADAGPDILYAKIWINEVEWSGSVEFHVKASDWKQHKHQFDKGYNNVILHFVADSDAVVYTQNNRTLPNFVFPELKKWYNIFETTFETTELISCKKYWKTNLESSLKLLLNKMAVERLEAKHKVIEHLLSRNHDHWEEVLYQLTARYMGQKLNGDIFELLARSLPQYIIGKHKNSLFQIEALLFGQAGLLRNKNISDDYFKSLQKEYTFLQKKYELRGLDGSEWKFLRLRPANFPTLRIAQLAMLMHKTSGLFSRLLEKREIKEFRKLFSFGVSPYWKNHYIFGEETMRKSNRNIGKGLQDILIVNVVVPLIFSYAYHSDNVDLQEEIIEVLDDVSGEDNYIIRAWKEVGIEAKTAYQSQALIQLTEKYCKFRHCEQCILGHEILKQRYGI